MPMLVGVLLGLEVLVFLFAYWINKRDIFCPSCTMCLVYIFSTFFTLLNVERWDINYSIDAILILVSGLFVFSMTEACVGFAIKHIKTSGSGIWIGQSFSFSNQLIVIVYIIQVIAMVGMYISVCKITHSSGLAALSIYRRMNTAHAITSDAKLSIGIVLLNRFMRSISYVSIFILVNNAFTSPKGRNNHKYVFFALYLIYGCFLNSSRGEVIKIISFVVASFYCTYMNMTLWSIRLEFKYLLRIAIGIIAFIPLFYYSSILINRFSKDISPMDYISNYIGGSIQLFNLYVTEPIDSTGGFETLSGLRSLLLRLGVINQASSTHLEFRWLTPSMHGNVYTFFRSPLHDFGYAGAMYFTAIVSALFAILYYGYIRERTCEKDKLVLYSYLFSWITMSSIAQMSVSYISIGSAVEVFFLMFIAKYLVQGEYYIYY